MLAIVILISLNNNFWQSHVSNKRNNLITNKIFLSVSKQTSPLKVHFHEFSLRENRMLLLIVSSVYFKILKGVRWADQHQCTLHPRVLQSNIFDWATTKILLVYSMNDLTAPLRQAVHGSQTWHRVQSAEQPSYLATKRPRSQWTRRRQSVNYGLTCLTPGTVAARWAWMGKDHTPHRNRL